MKKLAKFRQLQSWRKARDSRRLAPANDNRPNARDSEARPGKRPRLICRWFLIEQTNRLGCRWEIEGPDGRDCSSDCDGRSDRARHKSFAEPSQPENPGRLARDVRPIGRPQAALFNLSLAVLPAGHSQMPSDGHGPTLLAIANRTA